jgi:outer membrane protein TolC
MVRSTLAAVLLAPAIALLSASPAAAVKRCESTPAAGVRGGSPDRANAGFAGPERTESTFATLHSARRVSLEEALRMLDAQSLTLAQARARADEARAVVRQAAAPLLPALSGGGSYTRNSASATISLGELLGGVAGSLGQGVSQALGRPVQIPFDTSQLPAPIVLQPLEVWTGSANLRVPLVVPAAWFDLAAAKQSELGAQAAAEAARLQLRAGFAQAAWASSAAEEVVAASKRAVETAREHAQSAERAVRAGTGAPLAALQAQTELVRRESDLARATAERDRAHLALGVLLGRAEPLEVAVPEPSAPASFDLTRLATEALERRPEVRAQSAQVAAAERQVESAWSRLAPQLAVNVSAFASTVAYPTGDKAGWKASADLTWSLYDGGHRYGRRDQAAAQAAGASAALGAQRVEIRREVQDAVRDIEVAKERFRLAVQQKGFASEAAASAKRSFEAGLASSLDVLDANDRVYQAEVALADARARLGAAVVALDRAVGRLL